MKLWIAPNAGHSMDMQEAYEMITTVDRYATYNRDTGKHYPQGIRARHVIETTESAVCYAWEALKKLRCWTEGGARAFLPIEKWTPSRYDIEPRTCDLYGASYESTGVRWHFTSTSLRERGLGRS